MLNEATLTPVTIPASEFCTGHGDVQRLANLSGTNYQNLSRWVKRPDCMVVFDQAGVSIIPPSRKRRGAPYPTATRNQEVVERYQLGETLQEIGIRFGVTRERIRQILVAQGVDPKSGGSALVARKRRKSLETKREREFFAKWGMTKQEKQKLHVGADGTYRGSPVARYHRQRQNALKRNIPWEFTLGEWWEVWSNSGKWDQAGRGKGKYAMARLGDKGPYAPWNVKIIAFEQNSSEFMRRYQAEVAAGKRPPPNRTVYNHTCRPDKFHFQQIEVAAPLSVVSGSKGAFVTNVYAYGKKTGRKYKTTRRGGVVVVERIK